MITNMHGNCCNSHEFHSPQLVPLLWGLMLLSLVLFLVLTSCRFSHAPPPPTPPVLLLRGGSVNETAQSADPSGRAESTLCPRPDAYTRT